MKISIVFLVVVLFFAGFNAARAQEEFHYNFGNTPSGSGTGYSGVQAALNASLLVPLNEGFRSVNSSGIGANVHLKYMFDGKFTLGAYAGYNLVAGRTPIAGQTYSLLQYGGMIEYFLFNGSSPYLGLDIGNYTYALNVSNTSTGNNSFSYSRTNLGIGPNIGYVINLNPNMQLNTNLKYNHVFNSIISGYNVPTQFLQLTVGLVFNLSYTPPASTDE